MAEAEAVPQGQKQSWGQFLKQSVVTSPLLDVFSSRRVYLQSPCYLFQTRVSERRPIQYDGATGEDFDDIWCRLRAVLTRGFIGVCV